MKKILVISDSHGRKSALETLIMENNFDNIFYLGDGIRDIEWLDEDEYNISKVAGNCDYFSTESKVRVVAVDGIRFLLTHGDLFNVKFGLWSLLKETKDRHIQVVCFGHTHKQIDETEDGIRLLNPGSFRNGNYMVLEIENGKILKITKM